MSDAELNFNQLIYKAFFKDTQLHVHFFSTQPKRCSTLL